MERPIDRLSPSRCTTSATERSLPQDNDAPIFFPG